MDKIRLSVWEENEYTWPQAYGFVPFIRGYIHEDKLEGGRPGIVVIPGGAYYITSPTEAEIVALEFYERGYNTFVITYTTNILGTMPIKEQPMKDLARAIRLVRSKSEEFNIAPGRIVTCGFSAGGHLTAMEGVCWKDFKESNPEYASYSARPDAMLLCYPVITSGEYTHQGSMDNLIGKDCTEEEKEYMAAQKHVSADTPPCFLWQTRTDGVVPVMNSYLFAEACRDKGIVYAQHVFSQGAHGLSLATKDWEKGLFGELYTLEPFDRILEAVKNGQAEVSEEKYRILSEVRGDHQPGAGEGRKANSEVAVWPELADTWLKSVLR